jgi:hypothetical protein
MLTVNAITGKMMPMDNGFPVFALGLPFATLLVSGGAFGFYFVESRKQKAIESWPTTRGQITDSELVEDVSWSRDSDRDERIVRTYTPDIRFSYRVGKTDYAAASWKPGGVMAYGTRRFGEEVVARYPVGQDVAVYYDPAHPDVAVLDPKNRDGSGLPIVLGVLVGGVGMVIMGLLTYAATGS